MSMIGFENFSENLIISIKSRLKPVCSSYRFYAIFPGLVLCTTSIWSQKEPVADPVLPQTIVFEKKQIATESYESVGVFDVNNDGALDIVSGAFWYEGPLFAKRHSVGGPKRFGEYYDHFSTIPFDVNSDGKTDFITGGWFEKKLVWKENNGSEEWPEHLIAEVGNIESTRAWDMNGDGVLEIVPNTPNDALRIVFWQNGKFEVKIIAEKQGHGLGYGDLNGDGRGDIVVPHGWLEAPEDIFNEEWVLHEEFQLGSTSVPTLVTDVNGDGLNDLIVGQGHGYGLHWYEQSMGNKKKGSREWSKHPIDPFNSQYHTMEMADLDGDGVEELVTGKRYKAHNGNDPGGYDPIGLYYFRWNGESFSKQVIDFGVYGEGKGTGVSFEVIDLNEDGRPDIVVPGKDGLSVYFNKELNNELKEQKH